jgi:hypothetical protein
MIEYKPVKPFVTDIAPNARANIAEIVSRRPGIMGSELLALFKAMPHVAPLRAPSKPLPVRGISPLSAVPKAKAG